MAHLKRQSVPKSWPIERKGSKFVVRPLQGLHRGIPVLIALRNMLGLVQNRKEAKIAINMKKIELNNKIVVNEKKLISLFDILKIVPLEEHYRLELNEKGKFELIKIDKKDADRKVCKIIGKKILKGKKTQLNLGDGNNIVSDIKCNTNDSIVLNLKNRKAEKCIPLKKGAKVFVFAGKHTGKRGIIEEIISERKMAKIKVNNDKINVLIKQIIAFE